MSAMSPTATARGRFRRLGSFIVSVLTMAIVMASTPDPAPASWPGEATVIEHLRVQVPQAQQSAWLEAERKTWEPWLRSQSGFLGRDLYWDRERQEGVILIFWASEQQWKSIPQQDIDLQQRRFEDEARVALAAMKAPEGPGAGETDRQGRTLDSPVTPGSGGSPFPLVSSGALLPVEPLSAETPAPAREA